MAPTEKGFDEEADDQSAPSAAASSPTPVVSRSVNEVPGSGD